MCHLLYSVCDSETLHNNATIPCKCKFFTNLLYCEKRISTNPSPLPKDFVVVLNRDATSEDSPFKTHGSPQFPDGRIIHHVIVPPKLYHATALDIYKIFEGMGWHFPEEGCIVILARNIGEAKVHCPYHDKMAWLEGKEEKAMKKGKWEGVKRVVGIE